MPSTTIHIPGDLLETVDARAREYGLSRNRFILNALERCLAEEGNWSPGFLAALRTPVTRSDANAVTELVAEVTSRRTSKPAPRL